MWWFWTKDATEADKEKFRARVWIPPKGEAVTDARSPWSPENEMKAFRGIMASLGLKPGGGEPEAAADGESPPEPPPLPPTP